MILLQIPLIFFGAYLLIRGLVESRLLDGQAIEKPVYFLLYAVSVILFFGGLLLPLICTAFQSFIWFRIFILLLSAVLLFLFVTAALIAAAPCHASKADGNESVLLVLGAPVIQDQPSLILRSRAELAAEWAANHPKTQIIIAGGKGGLKSEAETIAELMAEKGIDQNRLFLENQSTTTEENFRCIKELTGEEFDYAAEPVVVLTNAFHIFRLRYFAQRQGYGNVHIVAAETPSSVRLLWYTREVVLTVRYWFTGLS